MQNKINIKNMNKNIQEFIKTHGEIFQNEDEGDGYRCSVYLNDGTYLPCVMLRESKKIVDLALRRFEQEKSGTGFISDVDDPYKEIVKRFIVSGNKINSYDINTVEQSKYAFPLNLLEKLYVETTMSWTGFVLEMSDGKFFQYGTNFLVEFFDLPEGYSFNDVVQLHNHSYTNRNGELKPLQEGYYYPPDDYDISKCYRERPYFICYTDRF